MTDENLSVAEALEAAFEQHEEAPEEEAQAEHENAEVEGQDEPDENLGETNEPEVPNSPEEPTPQKTDAGESPEDSDTDRDAKNEAPVKAPASWSASARETWKDLPKSAQEQVMKREREITMTLQQTAGARNMARQLNETLAPYKDALIAQGVQNPLDAVSTLLATENRLRSGTAQEKAYTVATLIKNYGVDVQALDNMLASGGHQGGDTNSQQAVQPDIQRLIQEQLAPYNQFMQQQQQAQQYAMQQEQANAHQTIEEFSKNAEFLPDVRMQVAEILDNAAKNNVAMELQQAYDIACQIHPEVSKVIAARKQQQTTMNTNHVTQQKRAAAASIRGERGGNGNADRSKMDMRSQISDIWNEIEGAV